MRTNAYLATRASKHAIAALMDALELSAKQGEFIGVDELVETIEKASINLKRICEMYKYGVNRREAKTSQSNRQSM